jgi:hypothetical protein
MADTGIEPMLFGEADLTGIAAVIAAIFGGLSTLIGAIAAYLTRRQGVQLDKQDQKLDKQDQKIELNTTISTAAAANAVKAKNEAVKASAVLQEKVDKTHDAVNGRTTELVEKARQAGKAESMQEVLLLHTGVVHRIEGLERQHQILKDGQVDIVKSINQLAEVLERKMGAV